MIDLFKWKRSAQKGIFLVLALPCALSIYTISGKGKEIVFEETVIEGKIRRPQVVLITADQRPDFAPMAINSFHDTTALIEKITPSIFEQNHFEEALNLDFDRH